MSETKMDRAGKKLISAQKLAGAAPMGGELTSPMPGRQLAIICDT